MNKRRNENKGVDSSCGDGSPFIDPVVISLEDHLNLHPFQPKEIPSVVEEYLEQCRQAGIREVRLIHGKGKGVQRNIIRSLLEKHPNVESFHDAPLEAGSWGATIVTVKAET
jgi:DNA-nicking Smr family endonuclease